jgi:hypothetical protein
MLLLVAYISFWGRALFQADGYLRGYVHPSSFLNLLTINTQKFQLRYSIIYKGPTNALVFIKTLIQMSHTKTFKVTPTCFDHQMIIIRELSDPV